MIESKLCVLMQTNSIKLKWLVKKLIPLIFSCIQGNFQCFANGLKCTVPQNKCESFGGYTNLFNCNFIQVHI